MAKKLEEARRDSSRYTWALGLKLARQDGRIVLAWSNLTQAFGLKRMIFLIISVMGNFSRSSAGSWIENSSGIIGPSWDFSPQAGHLD